MGLGLGVRVTERERAHEGQRRLLVHITAAAQAQHGTHCLQPTRAAALQARQGVEPTLPPASGRPAAALAKVPRLEERAVVRVVSHRDRNCEL